MSKICRVLLTALLLFCLPFTAVQAKKANPDASPKHGASTYYEETEESRLLVDVFAAYYSDGEAFLPLQVCVAVKQSADRMF